MLTFAFNIVSVVAFSLLIFFICFAKVGDYYYSSNWGTQYYVISVFGVGDVRFMLAILALVFSAIMLLASVISLIYKNKYFEIIKHIFMIIAIALMMVSAIFNVTYRFPVAHFCTILEFVFVCVLLVFEVVLILRAIIKYFKNYI